MNGASTLVGQSIAADERRSLARYREAISQVGDGFFVVDTHWRLLEVNEALCRMFRCTEADLIGRNPLELVTESSRALMLQTMELVAKTDRRTSRYDGVRSDGTIFPALVRAFTHRDPAGNVDSSVGFVTDLSDMVQAEQAIARSQREFAAILDNLQDTYYRTDAQGRLLRVSRSCERLVGYQEREGLGLDLATFYFEPGDRNRFLAALKAGGGSVSHYEERMRHRDGREVWVSTNAQFVYDDAGKPIGVEGIARDITDLRRAREELRLAAQVFRAATEAILITDPSLNVISVNPAFVELLGIEPAQAVGRPLLSYALIDGGSAGERELQHALETRGNWSGEVWSRRRNGIGFPCWLSLSAVRDGAGAATQWVAILSDITERKATQARFEFLAHHDPLTLLPNRLLLRDRVEQSISRAARSQATVAILFVDLDDFKRVNDEFGHQTGDAVLREIGRRLLNCVRSTDTVCRHGGDEFVIALTDLNDVSYVPEITEKVRHEVQLPIPVGNQVAGVSCSIGSAIYPRDGRDHDALLAHADASMYSVKRNTGVEGIESRR
jgi:diguanylate cyclase (GGDEF)-like protein/PAS domain S-box-containing protein